jgi:hypothetical protein
LQEKKNKEKGKKKKKKKKKKREGSRRPISFVLCLLCTTGKKKIVTFKESGVYLYIFALVVFKVLKTSETQLPFHGKHAFCLADRMYFTT